MEKKCFKCQVIKPLSDYYKHKQMGDGHLNKCKICTKKDVDKREKEKRKMYRVSTNVSGFDFGELLDSKHNHVCFLDACLKENFV